MMLSIKDIHTVLQDADIKNLNDAMIEDVLAHHIRFTKKLDVIHFFRFITLIKDDKERINRVLSLFENTTVLSFWMGMTRCNARRIQCCVLDFYSYQMKNYNIAGKIRHGTFLYFIPDSIHCEEKERSHCFENIHNWIRNEVNIT